MTSQHAKLAVAAMCLWWAAAARGVSVETWSEDEPEALEKGTCDRTVISSLGRVMLGRDQVELLAPSDATPFINDLAQGADGTIYAAGGPSGAVYRLRKGQAKAEVFCKIDGADNLFSLLIAVDGSVLVGGGGAVGRIYKIDKAGEADLWFDPGRADIQAPEKKAKDKKKTSKGKKKDDGKQKGDEGDDTPSQGDEATTQPTTGPSTTKGASATGPAKHPHVNYIWAMARGKDGKVYAATGADGWLLEIAPDGQTARVVFDSEEANLLCLVFGRNGELYTGSDKRGLVYRVDAKSGKPYVLYDAEEEEVSTIAVDEEDNVYAATAAASMAKPGKSAKPKPSGRPGSGTTKAASSSSSKKSSGSSGSKTVRRSVPGSSRSSSASSKGKSEGNAVYRIAPDGMVTEVFRESVMVLDMVEAGGSLYLGTGNEGRVYELRPDKEEQIGLAKLDDKQVTAVLRTSDGRLVLGASNEGRIVRLSSGYAKKGTFVSQVLDAKQISRWGRVSWEGEQPAGTKVTIATRSGNVTDPEEGTWDAWSQELDAKQGAQIPSPSARLLQYRLTLETTHAKETPCVRLVRLARQADNLPPKITAVEVGDPLRTLNKKRGSGDSDGRPRPLPPGTTPVTRIIKWKTEEPNDDELRYDVYFRMLSHKRWIRLREDYERTELKWDSSKVGDGEYEIRIVAKDTPSNPPRTALATDRISDPFVVDNSPPTFEDVETNETGPGSLTVRATVIDQHSRLVEAHYAVDSHEDWIAVLAEDDLFDSKREPIRFELEKLDAGEHVIMIRAEDEQDNVGYRTVVVTLKRGR